MTSTYISTSNDVLYCYGENGELNWQQVLGPGADYRVYESGVAAWQGTQLFLIAKDGSMLYSGALNTEISSCALCSNYAAVETVSNGQNVLQVIEHNGKVIDTLDMSSLTLLDYGFFSDNAMMWVMTLNTEGHHAAYSGRHIPSPRASRPAPYPIRLRSYIR